MWGVQHVCYLLSMWKNQHTCEYSCTLVTDFNQLFSGMCASVALSFWPLSAPRWPSLWWWLWGSSSASSSPSCTSKTPSPRGTGWARPWSSWALCCTQRCGAACGRLWVDLTSRRRRPSEEDKDEDEEEGWSIRKTDTVLDLEIVVDYPAVILYIYII